MSGVTETSLALKESATATQQLFLLPQCFGVSLSVSHPQIKLEQRFAAFLDFHQKLNKKKKEERKKMWVGVIIERA